MTGAAEPHEPWVAQTHCRFCHDAIVRTQDRNQLEEWPDEVVCPTCLPLAEAGIADGLVLDVEAGPFITLAQVASLVALTLVASTFAGLVLLVAHAGRWAW